MLCDVWGVLHDGVRAIPSACEALGRTREAGKPVLLVSNAPRPSAAVEAHLAALGVPRAAYDAVLTSGDLTRAHLRERPGLRAHAIRAERDGPLYEGLDIAFVAPEAADLVVATNLRDDEAETIDDYEEELGRFLALGLPFVCANPDVVVERGPKLVYCAGALADRYQAMGGRVVWFGKPHPPVYAEALKRLGVADPRRVLAIGDSIRTDLVGAARAGMPSLFVAGGVHAAEAGGEHALDRGRLARLFAAAGVDPLAVVWRLAW